MRAIKKRLHKGKCFRFRLAAGARPAGRQDLGLRPSLRPRFGLDFGLRPSLRPGFGLDLGLRPSLRPGFQVTELSRAVRPFRLDRPFLVGTR